VLFGDSGVKAAVIINAVESNGDVVFTYSGSVDTAGLGSLSYNPYPNAYISPINSLVVFNSGSGYNVYDLFTPGGLLLSGFGSGSVNISTSSSGNSFGFYGPINGGNGAWLLPASYASNTTIGGTMAFSGQSFTSLGLNQGTYAGRVPSGDTITMNIGPVPTPAPLPLLGLGAATAFSRKLKQRIALRRKREEIGSVV